MTKLTISLYFQSLSTCLVLEVCAVCMEASWGGTSENSPGCVVSKIRDTLPSESCTGFQYPRPVDWARKPNVGILSAWWPRDPPLQSLGSWKLVMGVGIQRLCLHQFWTESTWDAASAFYKDWCEGHPHNLIKVLLVLQSG